MKRLSREAFERARAFLKSEARPLDRALFEHEFEGAPGERAIEELARYQNQDGGFGRALEPDLRTPSSSALATEIGLTLLKELGCGAGHPMVQKAVRYLLATLDPGTRVWRVVPGDANGYPHAPWWHDEGGSLARTFDHFEITPRAGLVGLLQHYSSLVPAAWLEDLTERAVAAVEAMAARKAGLDQLVYALGLAEAPELPEPYRERLGATLRVQVQAAVTRDPQLWGSYCTPPLKLAPSPHSPVANLLWDDLQRNLDYEIEHQTPAGTWEPVWTWGPLYPEVWPEARREWTGDLTRHMLRTLLAFGRMEG